MKLFYRIARSCFKGFFLTFNRHKIFGREHLPEGPCILAPNHASYYDPPLVSASCEEEIFFLARDSLFKGKPWRKALENLNAYPISGLPGDLTSFKIVIKLLKEGKKVVIFPEGTRTEDGGLISVKTGISMLAQRSNCVIVPIYLHGTFHVWPRQKKLPRLWKRTACVFGSTIDSKDFVHLDRKKAQEEIAKAVKNSLEDLHSWYERGAEGSPP